MKATVELQETHTRGMLVLDKRVWCPNKNKNVEIIDSVDIELVQKIMKRALGHQ